MYFVVSLIPLVNPWWLMLMIFSSFTCLEMISRSSRSTVFLAIDVRSLYFPGSSFLPFLKTGETNRGQDINVYLCQHIKVTTFLLRHCQQRCCYSMLLRQKATHSFSLTGQSTYMQKKSSLAEVETASDNIASLLWRTVVLVIIHVFDKACKGTRVFHRRKSASPLIASTDIHWNSFQHACVCIVLGSTATLLQVWPASLVL